MHPKRAAGQPATSDTAARRSADADPPQHQTRPPGSGSWRDVYADHFPAPAARADATFDRGVGLDGYDRKQGVDVPTEPALKGPEDKRARADPFAHK